MHLASRLPLVLFFAAHALAQERGGPPEDVRAVELVRGAGLQERPYGWLGLGPGYKARFESGLVTLVPALGSEAPRNLPLSLRIESVRVGASSLPLAPARVARAGDAELVHDRGAVIERWRVTERGLELALELEVPPGAWGEVVVGARLETPLALPADGEPLREVALVVAGLGGVRLAATGTTAALRFEGTQVELVAAIDVAHGASSIAVGLRLDAAAEGGVATALRNADVAYDRQNDLYLIVFERHYSALDVDVVATRVQGATQLDDPVKVLQEDGYAIHPSVANVVDPARFLVVWQEGLSPIGPWDVRGIAVDAEDLGLSPTIDLAATVANEIQPDVGGEALPFGPDNAMLVYLVPGQGVRAVRVALGETGSPAVIPVVLDVTSDSAVAHPRISQSGGAAGRWAVVWQRFFTSPPPGDHDLYVAVIDRSLSLVVPPTGFGGTLVIDEQNPAVDGDGESWIVAYQRRDTPTDDWDIVCREVEWSAGSVTLSAETVLVGDPLRDEIEPAVSYAVEKTFVAWSASGPEFDYDVSLLALETLTCKVCQEPDTVFTPGTADRRPNLASAESGQVNAGIDTLTLAFHGAELSPPFLGPGYFLPLEVLGDGGPVATIGGACGVFAGVIDVPPTPHGKPAEPAAVGNPDFAVRLSSYPASADVAVLLVRQAGPPPLACGSCAVAFPALATFVHATGPVHLVQPLPIPCDPALLGAVFEAQWAVLPTADSPCPLVGGTSLTDRLQFTIGP